MPFTDLSTVNCTLLPFNTPRVILDKILWRTIYPLQWPAAKLGRYTLVHRVQKVAIRKNSTISARSLLCNPHQSARYFFLPPWEELQFQGFWPPSMSAMRNLRHATPCQQGISKMTRQAYPNSSCCQVTRAIWRQQICLHPVPVNQNNFADTLTPKLMQ